MYRGLRVALAHGDGQRIGDIGGLAPRVTGVRPDGQRHGHAAVSMHSRLGEDPQVGAGFGQRILHSGEFRLAVAGDHDGVARGGLPVAHRQRHMPFGDGQAEDRPRVQRDSLSLWEISVTMPVSCGRGETSLNRIDPSVSTNSSTPNTPHPVSPDAVALSTSPCTAVQAMARALSSTSPSAAAGCQDSR